ncbi:haloacid dehalogenase type II [Actinomycetospora sp. OC33-EN08]|uniref:Haloacid dehalogenase type II n=1 Tax=Actinomycetospora aurantiaca TaxID=3129233 RepID=A0ABU8ML97_9PSEU
MTDLAGIEAVMCDVFGTVVDWRTGVAQQIDELLRARGVDLDGGLLADEWRERYQPSMRAVNDGGRWRHLDDLHRESLDDLLAVHGVDDEVDDVTRAALVRTWHRLPAWPDSTAGLRAIGEHCVVATLSNGGVALLTHLVKAARLPFDVILSAELARRYKPDPAAYETAVGLLDLRPEQVLMVAAHQRDIEGARSVGMATAFVERPHEMGPHRSSERAADSDADVVVGDLRELARRVRAAKGGDRYLDD